MSRQVCVGDRVYVVNARPVVGVTFFVVTGNLLRSFDGALGDVISVRIVHVGPHSRPECLVTVRIKHHFEEVQEFPEEHLLIVSEMNRKGTLMSTCEKCWSDAHVDPYLEVSEQYRKLLAERVGDKKCTPEQQAGPGATPCLSCGGRLVRHQHTGQCMVTGHGAPGSRA